MLGGGGGGDNLSARSLREGVSPALPLSSAALGLRPLCLLLPGCALGLGLREGHTLLALQPPQHGEPCPAGGVLGWEAFH